MAQIMSKEVKWRLLCLLSLKYYLQHLGSASLQITSKVVSWLPKSQRLLIHFETFEQTLLQLKEYALGKSTIFQWKEKRLYNSLKDKIKVVQNKFLSRNSTPQGINAVFCILWMKYCAFVNRLDQVSIESITCRAWTFSQNIILKFMLPLIKFLSRPAWIALNESQL